MNSTAGNPRRGLTHSAFIVVAAILLVAAIALNAAVSGMKLHFKKEPIPQPRDFHELPERIGTWIQVSQDDKLDKEMEDVLGTEQYVYRDYLRMDEAGIDLLVYLARGADKATTQPSAGAADERLVAGVREKYNSATPDQQARMIRDALNGKSVTERKEIAYAIELRRPGSVVHLGLTYYTGLVDTVAHIPDRCYIADGYEPSSYDTPTWNLTDANGKNFPLGVRFISFADQTGSNRVPKCVAYVFHVNGHYDSDPLGVRQTLQDLTQRYGYYAKIELMTIGENTAVASAAMTDFLSDFRPQIESCFPDWDAWQKSHH